MGSKAGKRENHVKNFADGHCVNTCGQTIRSEKSLAQGVRLFY